MVRERVGDWRLAWRFALASGFISLTIVCFGVYVGFATRKISDQWLHQERESLISSVGWQASGNLGWIKPFGRVTWEKEYRNNDRSINAGLVSMPGTFSLPAFKTDDDYLLFNIGASADIGAKAVGFVSVSATGSKNDGNYQAFTIGVRVPL